MQSSPGNPIGPTVEGSEINIPSAAQGDILYYNGTTWTRLAAGTSGQLLETQGAAANPHWASQTTSIATGTYTGDGSTSQAITGVGFQPKFVMVYEKKSGEATVNIFHVTDQANTGFCVRHTGSGNHDYFNNDADDPGIKSLDADGFTVDDAGTDLDPNKNGITYEYLALG